MSRLLSHINWFPALLPSPFAYLGMRWFSEKPELPFDIVQERAKKNKGRLLWLSILLLLFSFAPMLLCAQGIQDSIFHIQPVRVSSSKIFNKELAGMKEIMLDSSALREQVNRNLTELLSENTLVHIKDYGRGAMSTASFRGAAASHTQVSWNGMNINSPMLGMVDFSLIPVFILDDVSLKHSSASVSEQGGGLGGLIQLENKADWANRVSGRFYQDIGSFGTVNEFGQLSLGNKRLQSTSRLYFNHSDNDYEFTNHKVLEIDPESGEIYHPKQKNDNADYGKSGFTQELYWRAGEKTTVDGQLWYQHAERAIPTVHSSEFYGESGQISNQQNDKTLKAAAHLKHYGEDLNLAWRAGYDLQKMGYYTETMINGGSTYRPVNSGLNSNTIYNSVKLEWDKLEKLSLHASASYKHHNASTLDTTSQSGYDISLPEISLFGGAYYSPFKKIQVAGQVRKEWFGEQASPLIYTLGLNYKPFDIKDLVLKGNFARNYHHPTLHDLYWQPGGNPNLLPEEGHSAELSVHFKQKNGALDMTAEITAYQSTINNWIIWLPGLKGYWVPENIREVRSYGLEYSFITKYTYKKTVVKTNGNISVSRTLNMENNSQLPFIPKMNGNLFISVHNRGFNISYLHNAIGSRSLLFYTGENNNEMLSNTNNFYELYPHFLNKASLGKSFAMDHFDLSLELKIMNLFDEEYRNILQRFMPGRHYLLMLKIDF